MSKSVLFEHGEACEDLRVTASRTGETAVKVALLTGICMGVAAALTSVFPASAYWTQAFVCRGGYELAYRTSRYTQSSNRTSTSVHFQCVGAADWYDANVIVIGALQTLLVALVLGTALATVRAIERRRAHRSRPSADETF